MRGNKISKERFVVAVEEVKDFMFRLSFSILANTSDAEDAVAEAILKAWENRNQIRNVEKLGRWIVCIAANISRDMLVKRGKEVPVGNKELAAYIEEEIEAQTDIWSMVSGIKEINRTSFLMYYYAGYSVKEIAKMLHIAEGTVKSRLSRAREELREMIEE